MTYAAAVVGVAGVGRRHGQHFRENEDIDLVAIADADPDALSEYGERWAVPEGRRYESHDAMLEAEDLDAVSIATPSYLHRDHVIDAARSRADPTVIWCEKPIATSVSDAEEMIEACEDADVELLINHSRRWSEALETLRELVLEERLLGDVRSINAVWPHELLRNGTHLVDLLLYVLGEPAVRVSGYLTGESAVGPPDADIEIDDCGGAGHVVTDADTFLSIDATHPRGESATTLHLVGDAGRMQIDLRGGEWRYWTLEDGAHVERSHPAIEDGWQTTVDEFFRTAVENIVELLAGRGTNRSPGTAGRDALEILVAIFVSEYTGATVSLPLDRPLRDVEITSW